MSLENKNIVLGMELLISQNIELLSWCRTLLDINSKILSCLSDKTAFEIHEHYFNNIHSDLWSNEKDIAVDMFHSLKHQIEENPVDEIGESENSIVHF